MKEFKKTFIIQLIIDFLVFGIIYLIIGRILTGVLVNAVNMSGYAVCYPVVLIQSIGVCLAVVSAFFVTQKAVSKKDVSAPDDPDKFYRILCIVAAALIAGSTLISIGSMVTICLKNIEPLSATQALKAADPDLTPEQLAEKFRSIVKMHVTISSVIGAVIQAAVIVIMNKPLSNRHYSLF